MADLVTHIGAALFFKGAVRGRNAPVFVLGTVMPDVCGRVVGIALSKLPGCPDLLVYGPGVIHMPLGMIAFSLLVALLFRADQRAAVFANLLAGALLHLAIDLLQHHVGTGYPLLFPFSSWHWELGLIGSEATIPWSIPVFLLGLGLWRLRGSRRPPAPPPAPGP
ncbi:MAG TPA: metal-dependent hydrolase [Myxococcota bacterium]|nr:metal-dependent hydrolase [Myxococcota bacterium]